MDRELLQPNRETIEYNKSAYGPPFGSLLEACLGHFAKADTIVTGQLALASSARVEARTIN
jgi:hypothetical protein